MDINTFKQLLSQGEYENIDQYYDTYTADIDKELLLTHNESYSIAFYDYISKKTKHYTPQYTLQICACYNNIKLMAHIFNQEKQKHKQVLSEIVPYNTDSITIEYCTLFDFRPIIANIKNKTDINIYDILIQNGCILLDKMIDSIICHIAKPNAKECIDYVLSKLEEPEIKMQYTESKDFLKNFGVVSPYANNSDSIDKLSTCAQSMCGMIYDIQFNKLNHKAKFFTVETLINCCKKYNYPTHTTNKYVLTRIMTMIIKHEISEKTSDMDIECPVLHLLNGIIIQNNWELLSCEDKHNFLASYDIKHDICTLERMPETFKKAIVNEQEKYLREILEYKKINDVNYMRYQ